MVNPVEPFRVPTLWLSSLGAINDVGSITCIIIQYILANPNLANPNPR